MEELKKRLSLLLKRNQEETKDLHQKERKAAQKMEQMEEKLLSLISLREEAFQGTLEPLKRSLHKSLHLVREEVETFLESVSSFRSFCSFLLANEASLPFFQTLLFSRLKGLLFASYCTSLLRKENPFKVTSGFDDERIKNAFTFLENLSILSSNCCFLDANWDLKDSWSFINCEIRVSVNPVDLAGQLIERGNFFDHFHVKLDPAENIFVSLSFPFRSFLFLSFPFLTLRFLITYFFLFLCISVKSKKTKKIVDFLLPFNLQRKSKPSSLSQLIKSISKVLPSRSFFSAISVQRETKAFNSLCLLAWQLTERKGSLLPIN